MKAVRTLLIAVIVTAVGFWAAGTMPASAQDIPGGEQPEKAVKKPERKQARGQVDHGQMNRGQMNPEAQKRIGEQLRKQAQAMKKIGEEVKKLKREMAALKKMRNAPMRQERALRHEVPPQRKEGSQGRAGKRMGREGRPEQARRNMKQVSPERKERFREQMRARAKQLNPEQKERFRERMRERAKRLNPEQKERNPGMRERGREQGEEDRPPRRRRT